ncbi:cobalamin biosynthesis protein CobG [Kitasatospora sp. MAA19]|uniref:cobalamin biosynthesis protein CobG n=1 Tax=Kitasatospora sp. MAA19 TaxID=3035090 RepID=UPI002473E9E4|nr:cobalamin biosynthesis protein CobG [Kitasatospora sp. MAA19]
MPPTPDATAPGAAVPDRGRADACPGALRLHAADDGALARVRLPGGLLTVRQVLALADAAEALGDGELETTSRGNVQLRGLASHCGAELAERLRAVGLLPSDTHERVRNIVASPLAGLDAYGFADVQTWVRELDARLCASDWAAGLSGKFLFALDDGRGDVAALDADVTLIAGSDGAALLRLGRAAYGRPVPAGQVVTAALDAARAFLDALRAGGRKAWHLREAPDLLPAGSVPLPAFAGAAPAVGVVTGGARAAGFLAAGAGADGSATDGLAMGGAATDGSATDGAATDGSAMGGATTGGLSVGMRFGRATAAQWRELAGACAGEVRLTPWRGAVLPGAPADRLPALAAAGFRTAPGSPWERATACTGLPGCAKSLADVRSDAARALDAAASTGGRPAVGLPVHWSGCERRCGHPAGRWVDVLAVGQGYRVTVNGPVAARVAVDVTNEEMAEAVAEARRTTK